MDTYLLIESRDPFDCAAVSANRQLARDLRAAGHPVSLFLIQNGVLAARAQAQGSGLRELVGAGVEVLADSLSLAERAVAPGELCPGVESASIGALVDRLAAGARTLWT